MHRSYPLNSSTYSDPCTHIWHCNPVRSLTPIHIWYLWLCTHLPVLNPVLIMSQYIAWHIWPYIVQLEVLWPWLPLAHTSVSDEHLIGITSSFTHSTSFSCCSSISSTHEPSAALLPVQKSDEPSFTHTVISSVISQTLAPHCTHMAHYLLCGQSLVSGKKHYREIEFVHMR